MAVIDSNVNLAMKNSDLNVGVIVPPNTYYKPELFSDKEATDSFNKIQSEVYKNVETFDKSKKTPPIVKAIYWIGGTIASFFGGKKLYTFFKK